MPQAIRFGRREADTGGMAMPRFYLHVRTSKGLVPDLEGEEFEAVVDAKLHAAAAVVELASSSLLFGEGGQVSILIVDPADQPVGLVRLRLDVR
jgi:hypothetical protein